MPLSVGSLVARFKALPPAQQALLGVGVPVVAGAALIGNVRGKSTDTTEADTATSGVVAGAAPATIPFGAGLDDIFGLQSMISKVETRLSGRIDSLSSASGATAVGVGTVPTADAPPQPSPKKRPSRKRGVQPAGDPPQVVNDSQFVKSESTPATPSPTTRAIGRRPAVGAAEATSATVKAAPRRLATRLREQSRSSSMSVQVPDAPRKVAPRKIAPRKALKPLPRKIAPRKALKPLPRKIAPRKALKPLPQVNPRRRKVTGSRKVTLL